MLANRESQTGARSVLRSLRSGQIINADEDEDGAEGCCGDGQG